MSITFMVDGEENGPDFNMSNDNAYDVCNAAGLFIKSFGQWSVEFLPTVRQKLIILMNTPNVAGRETTDTQRMVVVEENNITTIRRGPRVVNIGLSAEGISERAQKLLNIVVHAHNINKPVVWG